MNIQYGNRTKNIHISLRTIIKSKEYRGDRIDRFIHGPYFRELRNFFLIEKGINPHPYPYNIISRIENALFDQWGNHRD